MASPSSLQPHYPFSVLIQKVLMVKKIHFASGQSNEGFEHLNDMMIEDFFVLRFLSLQTVDLHIICFIRETFSGYCSHFKFNRRSDFCKVICTKTQWE